VHVRKPYLLAVAAALVALATARFRRRAQAQTDLLWREATADSSR
jgi:hypothetical protein